jgi:Ser/Thr protein kinase RdoA (MazF antagonist)
VLPRLPISALRYYGFVDDDTARCWLFLEDAGDERYLLEVEEHRTLAGRWLGAMNTSAQRLAVGEALPNRGADFYLEGLRRARAMITKILGHPAVRADARWRTLEAIVDHCDRLETLWPSIERFCERIPQTLVHGDLVSKNVRIRAEQIGQRLLVMDWETAGWGIPAADLAQFPLERSQHISLSLDLEAYWAVVQPWWPNINLPDLRRLAELGNAFRLIVALSWMNKGFRAHTVEWYMTDMSWYEAELHDWLRTAEFQA